MDENKTNNQTNQTANNQNTTSTQNLQDNLIKKKDNKILIIALITAILGVGIFAFIFIKNNILNSPEKIYKNYIDNLTNLTTKTIDNYDINGKLFDYNLNIDTNYEELKSLSNYTYGINFGADSKTKTFEAKIYMQDKAKKEYSFRSYLKNNKLYEKFSSFDKLIDLGKTDNNSFEEILKMIENYDQNDYKYLVEKISTLLKNNLDSKKFSNEDKTIKVNNKEFKATKNIYKADGKEISRLTKSILNGLYKDDKAVKIMKKTYGISKKEIKEMIDEKTPDNSTNTTFGIYMIKGKFAGFDIQENDEMILSYYTESENFDLNFSTLSAYGVKNGNKTDISIKMDNSEIAKLNVNKFEESNINFDYEIILDPNGESNLKGKVLYKKESEDKNSLAISMKNGKDYVTFTINTNITDNAKIADIDEKKAINLSEEEMDKVINDFINSLKNTPIGDALNGYESTYQTDFDI